MRIVRGADCVDTEIAQRAQALLPHCQRNSSAERPAIGMNRRALYFDMTAVQPESGPRLEQRFAHTKRRNVFIAQFRVGTDHPHIGAVKRGVVQIPKVRPDQLAVDIQDGYALGSNMCRLRLQRGHNFSIRTDQIDVEMHVRGFGAFVGNFALHMHRGFVE